MIKLHHVNIVSHDVAGLDEFYRTALGLERIPDLPLIEIPGYSDTSSGEIRNPAVFLSAGDPAELQLHLCAPDQYLGARYGHIVSPINRGHIAYRCDDIEAVKLRLEAANIPYSDWGIWAVKGWHQIFFYDPVGTVVEVHQVME
jgi:glyoxylase I family protein